MLDILNDDAFSVVHLTDSINLAPYVPNRLGSMGLFETKNPTTHTVYLERKGNRLALVPSKRRGSGETTKKPSRSRDMLPLNIPHCPLDDEILAEDLVGIRAFDTEDQVETLTTILNDSLEEMRQDHELTHEWLRLGAIKGVIIDGDGSTELADLFAAFNITQTEVGMNFGSESIKENATMIIRAMESVLGGGTYQHIHALCGDNFYDLLTQDEETAGAYNEQTNYKYQIDQQGTGTTGPSTFSYGGIVWENYRGAALFDEDGEAVPFVDPDQCHFFPVGARGLFRAYFGPRNSMGELGKPGKEFYAMQEEKRWDEGIDVHTESNPLFICTRPSLLMLGHSGTAS